MKKFLSIIAAFVMFHSAVSARDMAMERKIDELLSRMTLAEKVGQLHQLNTMGDSDSMLMLVRQGKVGTILNDVDPNVINHLQREAVENSRLGIPLIFARDVIHGFHTIFPIPLGLAATWNEALVTEGARVAADEATSTGIRWTFSPMVDVSRDARWGRVAESAGEDVLLNCRMGVAMLRGYQGDDLSNPKSMAACAKHFTAYGASESGKDYNTTWIPDVLLRDVYLPPFKALSDAGCATFMCSFNDICGVPSSGNKYLLRDILRDEWGFDGVVVSDWGSIYQMINHGFSEDLRHAALQGATAGVDIDMMSMAYDSHLQELVESGEIDMALVDDMVRNVLRLKFRLGLFDNPYVDMATANRFYLPENLDAARRSVEESTILLKNDGGILPLKDKGLKIAVVGPMADAPHDQCGTWAGDIQKEHSVTPLMSLRKIYGDKNVIAAPGVKHSRDRSHDRFAEAVEAARKADVVLYFAGEEAVLSGEAHCRADISLPGAQAALMKELKATGKPVVLVVMTGRPMAIPDEIAAADAVIYSFHPGTMAGEGLANVLTGNANPGGRLPSSLPKMSGQQPLYYSHKNTGRPADWFVLMDDLEEEAGQTSTGCNSFFLDAGDGPLYPFGYGLDYTTFEYGPVTVSSETLNPDGSLTASCTITNTGNRPGTEVAQLYVRDLVASLARPVRELKDFKKISLAPGESQTVTFTVTPDMLAFNHLEADSAGRKLYAEPGKFHLWISPNSAAGEPVSFNLK